ncbi:MAG TPA: DNA repair exonuclease [Firmicutes bacterium]|nr:DNA repair exonuclease [Candidatus Fermentithermobacillaceae bacterium]
MLKIVHTADVHAGKPLSFELDKERGYIRRREIETGLWRIVDFVKEENAQILLIAGDLFEHLYARPSWVKDAALLFSTIPETRVFISPGNHDPLLPDSLYYSVDWPGNVTVFASTGVSRVSLGAKGIEADVYGLGWPAFVQRNPLLQGFQVKRPDRLNIVLLHGDLAEESMYLPVHSDHIANSGADYFALGHIHVPMARNIAGSTVVYSGCPEPLGFGDEGQRGVYLVTCTGEAGGAGCISAEFVPMALRTVRFAEVDLTGIDTGEQVRNAILSVGNPEARKKDMWKVALTGRLSPGIGLDLAGLRHEFIDEFFSLRLMPEFVLDYDLEPLMNPENQSLEARFVRRLMEIGQQAEQEGDTEAAVTVDRAMYYGLDALRQGEIITRRRLD